VFITTLNKIRECDPCKDGWETLLKKLNKTKADDDELSFLTILESNGFDDALWCALSAPEYEKEWRLFAVWCIEQLSTDEISILGLDVAEKYTNGEATKDELNAAWAAAWDAACAASRDSASAAAWAEASAEASVAASNAACASAWAAAWAAAWDAARDAQKEQFIKIISGE